MVEGDRGIPPRRIGMPDVERLERATARFRAIDYPSGGGACCEEVGAAVADAERLLTASASRVVRGRLLVALADLHNLAAWTCFDVGSPGRADRHWTRALALATEAADHSLVANIRYRTGRVHLHGHAPSRALGLFEAGARAARMAGSQHTTALLLTNQAWALAALGDRPGALRRLGQALDHFDRSRPDAAPAWARFFDEVDLSAMLGVVHTELALSTGAAHTSLAISALVRATESYGPGMARSRVFSLIALAVDHVLDGDFDHAARVAAEAVEGARGVRSARVVDRMRPLARLAERRGAADVSAAVADYLAAPRPAW